MAAQDTGQRCERGTARPAKAHKATDGSIHVGHLTWSPGLSVDRYIPA